MALALGDSRRPHARGSQKQREVITTERDKIQGGSIWKALVDVEVEW